MWFAVSCYRNSGQQQRVDWKSKSDRWTMIPDCDQDHYVCDLLQDGCKVRRDDEHFFSRRHFYHPPYPLYTQNYNNNSEGRSSSNGSVNLDHSPPPPRPPPPQPHKLYQSECVRFSTSFRFQIDDDCNDYDSWSYKENFRPQVILGMIIYTNCMACILLKSLFLFFLQLLLLNKIRMFFHSKYFGKILIHSANITDFKLLN